MAVKVTFTLDPETVDELERTARRLRKPKSRIVREAIRSYAAQPDRLSAEERQRMLGALRRFRALPTRKTGTDVERELKQLRATRRLPGHLHPPE